MSPAPVKRQVDALGVEKSAIGAHKRRPSSRGMFALYRDRAVPVADLVLLRRTIEGFKRSGKLWVPGDPKAGPRKALDAFISSKREYSIVEVVAVGPKVSTPGLVPGARVVVRSNSSLSCPSCGLPADRRDPIRRHRATCRRCGRKFYRDEGIMLGDTGWNPKTVNEGDREYRSSTYEFFMREWQVVALVEGDE